MKILHLLNDLGNGGAEAFVNDLVTACADSCMHSSMSVAALCLTKRLPEAHQERARALERAGVAVDALHGSTTRKIAALSKLLRRNRIELIHAHNLRAVIIASIARVLAGRPTTKIVFTQHTNHVLRPVLHRLYAKHVVDGYIAICRPAFLDMHDKLGNASVIRQIENGIPEFDGLALDISVPNKVNVAIVARFDPQKAHDIVLDGLKLLAKDRTIEMFHFLFIGDGGNREEIEGLAGNYLLSEHTTFCGNISNARRAFGHFDAILICSWREGLPVVALEAKRAGAPILCNSVGALPDMVTDGADGYLMPPRPEAARVRDALVRLADPVERRAIREGAQLTTEAFGMEECLEKHLELYATLRG